MSTTRNSRLLRIGDAASYLYGSNSAANRMRLSRLADSGEIRAIRMGERRDRWFATADLDRLLWGAGIAGEEQ